jgi:hypothetical protein
VELANWATETFDGFNPGVSASIAELALEEAALICEFAGRAVFARRRGQRSHVEQLLESCRGELRT